MKLIELLGVTKPTATVWVHFGDNEITGTPDDLRVFMDQSLLQDNISDIHAIGAFIIVSIISPVIIEW